MDLYNSPFITPENIVNITFQYRLVAGNSPNSQFTIYVSYNNDALTVVIQKRISLQEVRNYINYLQIKAALLGKSVIAQQFTDQKTVITIGDPIPVQNDKTYTFQLNGVNFSGSNTLTNIANFLVGAAYIADQSFIGAVATFKLPILTEGQFSFLQEYNIPVIADTYWYATPNVDTINWDVIFISTNTSPLTQTVNITSNNFVQVNVPDTFLDTTIIGSDGLNFKLCEAERTYIHKAAVGYSLLPVFPIRGALDIKQYNDATLLSTALSWAWFDQIAPVSLNVNRLDISLHDLLVNVNNNLNHPVFLNATFDVLEDPAFATFANNPNNSCLIKTQAVNINFNSQANIVDFGDAPLIFYAILAQGVTKYSGSFANDGAWHPIGILPDAPNWDEINLSATAFGSFSLAVQYGVGSPCAEAINTVFINHTGTFITGDTVYTDAGLTTPLAGFNQIVDPATNIIYLIDNVTGVVGLPSGASCPIAAPAAILNTADTTPPDNVIITDVKVDTVTVVGATFPVNVGEGTLGTINGTNNSTVDVHVTGTTGTTVRLIDGFGVFHDTPYSGAGIYPFVGVDVVNGMTVIVF